MSMQRLGFVGSFGRFMGKISGRVTGSLLEGIRWSLNGDDLFFIGAFGGDGVLLRAWKFDMPICKLFIYRL